MLRQEYIIISHPQELFIFAIVWLPFMLLCAQNLANMSLISFLHFGAFYYLSALGLSVFSKFDNCNTFIVSEQLSASDISEKEAC